MVWDGYFDLPHPLSVPFSACAVLVSVPFIVVMSIRGPAPDPALPESLRRFIRYSPFGLSALWLIAIVILVSAILSEVHVRSILH